MIDVQMREEHALDAARDTSNDLGRAFSFGCSTETCKLMRLNPSATDLVSLNSNWEHQEAPMIAIK